MNEWRHEPHQSYGRLRSILWYGLEGWRSSTFRYFTDHVDLELERKEYPGQVQWSHGSWIGFMIHSNDCEQKWWLTTKMIQSHTQAVGVYLHLLTLRTLYKRPWERENVCFWAKPTFVVCVSASTCEFAGLPGFWSVNSTFRLKISNKLEVENAPYRRAAGLVWGFTQEWGSVL